MPLSNPDQEGTLSFAGRRHLALLRLLAHILRFFGYEGSGWFGRVGGFFIWHALRSRRKLAVRAVIERLGKTGPEAERIARQSFTSNIQSFFEIVLAHEFKRYDNPRLLPENELFSRMQQEKRPLVVVSGHIGAWELMAGLMAHFRTDRPRVVVVRNHSSAATRIFMHELRSVGGGQSIGHRNATAVVLQILKENGTACFLVDHNANRRDAVFIPFLGKIAAVNIGPAMLALRAKAVIYPVFMLRKENGLYELENLPPLDAASIEGSIAERVKTIAQFYTAAMEEIIRRYPEQWFWMHKRWKTRPPGEDG